MSVPFTYNVVDIISLVASIEHVTTAHNSIPDAEPSPGELTTLKPITASKQKWNLIA